MEAKKAIREVGVRVYIDSSDRLNLKDGENDIYKFAQMREKKTRNLEIIMCIKDSNHKILVKDKQIKETSRKYFDKLFNSTYSRDVNDMIIPSNDLSRDSIHRIKSFQVKEILCRMKTRKEIQFLLKF